MSKQTLPNQPKIIILRGNSGSGKSSTARILQAKFEPNAIHIEQDYFRRKIIKEKEKADGTLNADLMLRAVEFGLEYGRNIIIDGILSSEKYSDFIKKIIRIHPEENYFFYFDIPFEETLRRHQTKPNSHEFGEKEMRGWFREHDLLGFVEESVINKDMSQDETVRLIQTSIGV